MTALAVDMPANFTHVDWIKSTKSPGKRTGQDSYNQYIDTGYTPNLGTVVRAKISLGAKKDNWSSIFGALDSNDSSSDGISFRYYNNANLNGLFCNSSYGQAQISGCTQDTDYEIELKRGLMTIGDQTATITTLTDRPFEHVTLYLFCENNWNNNKVNPRRGQPVTLYWLTIEDEGGLQRSFQPCLNASGEAGLWDMVSGQFYQNLGDDEAFYYGGFGYLKDASMGAVTAIAGGTVPAAAVTGISSLTVALPAADTAEAGSLLTSLAALTLESGALSFQDATATTCAVSGALTLNGGTELKFDVTSGGADAITAGSVAFAGTGTVKISVRGVGVSGVSAATPILTGGNLVEADLAKFTLAAGIPCELAIANGNLMLMPKAADPATWTATSGNWSTPGNWQEGQVPGAAAPVTIANTTGGTANQDISDLTISSLTVAADAGSFTTSGNALGITGSFTDNSTVEQTFTMPLTLGVAGSSFAVTSAGNLNLTGAITANADTLSFTPSAGTTNKVAAISGSGTLAKSGDGVLVLTAQSPNFSGPVEISGGTLVNTQQEPFPGSNGGAITVSNGGTLALSEAAMSDDKLKFFDRKLVVSGAGVGGKGAVTYNGGGHQYYAFREMELAGDATVGGDSGRWDIQPRNGIGRFDFKGHTLTKVGNGTFSLSNITITNTSEQVPAVSLEEGALLVEKTAGLTGSGTFDLASGAKLQIYDTTLPFSWVFNFAGGSVFEAQDANAADHNTVSGPVALGEGTVEFQVKNLYHAQFTGTMSGKGGVRKTQGGDLVFSGGAKTYEGGTEVAAGRLVVSAKDQLPGYAESGKVRVTGGDAGLMLSASGWTSQDFSTMLAGVTLGQWNSFVGYENDGAEAITLSSDYANNGGSLALEGASAPIEVTGNLAFPNGMLVASGAVTLSGEQTMPFKRVQMSGRDSVLEVKDGVTLTVDKSDSVVVGNVWTNPSSEERLVVENATVKAAEYPENNKGSGGVLLGTTNMGLGILEVKAGGRVEHKICGGRYEWSRSAILNRAGGTIVNYGGSGNDGYVSHDAYGFFENAGAYELKGHSQVQGGTGYPRAMGVLYNTSGTVTLPADSWGGQLDVSRGGTGVVYQCGGTIDINSTGILLTSQYGAERGCGVWTVDGPAALTKTTTLYGPNRNKTTGIVNVMNGGTLEYNTFTAREAYYDSEGEGALQPFYVNGNGGFLRPRTSGTLVKSGVRYEPTRVTAFAGGFGVDTPADVTTTLNVPVRRPEGRGIASITPSAAALAQDYIGAPVVQIMGDGYGATAVALYDSTTRRVTGVKVTSPGCGYTTATVKLVCAKANDNGDLDATATLTDAEQTCGGLVKKGAGTLKVTAETLPDFTEASKVPLKVLGGTLDLGGVCFFASELTLGEGAKIVNGTVVAQKIRTVGDAYVSHNISLAANGPFEAEVGVATVDVRHAGLMMKKFQCDSQDGVRELFATNSLDWAGAELVYGFDVANSTAGWSANQLLAYKGYIWNRSDATVTWTFGEHFDDGTRVMIDGETVLSDETYNAPKLATIQLAPGAHTFEVRFSQLGGGAGPANNTTQPDWTASTLAFGIDFTGSDSFDVTKFDHLADLRSGDVFTVDESEADFAPGSLDIAPGAGIAFNGDGQSVEVSHTLAFTADDLANGRFITVGNAPLEFLPGAAIDIDGELDFSGSAVYVVAEAEGGIVGAENITVTPSLPRGWKLAVLKGRRLAICRKYGFAIFVQ